ncbi:MAG: HAMP domain-containing sensor histidine kinase [Anaerolineales bacterium]|nr:HAMP domain-containing sensor histidine kinase [Anaerolineales bacterium]
MARALTLLGLATLVLGILAAVTMRLALPTTVLSFSALYDPASLLVIAAALIAAVLVGAGAFVRWQQAQTQRSLAAQAAALDAERRRFIQRLDHELKNPLTAIQVQLDNLQADTQAGPAIRDVRTQADRLSTLTRGLRRLADLESRPLELERVEIGELLDEMAELLQAPQRLTLDVQRVPWPIPPIQADRELLLMALRNLADNALKYSTGPVQVRARDLTGALLVEVIDTGRGILPADLPHVAEELYRGQNAHDVSGSGLGLAMVQRIVARHGGKLEIRSRPGQGTIATLQLPYEQPKTR